MRIKNIKIIVTQAVRIDFLLIAFGQSSKAPGYRPAPAKISKFPFMIHMLSRPFVSPAIFLLSILFWLFTVGVSQGAGQQVTSLYAVGLILDEQSGNPVPYAKILTRSGKELATANSKGRFSLALETKQMVLVFSKNGYENHEQDLTELTPPFDLEISLTPSVRQLENLDVLGQKRSKINNRGLESLQQLEKFQGMRIDLSEHLAQMQGVNLPTEYSSSLSVFGGRTQDATHYLGRLRMPNLRHLDFGFPGNQSVLNPRLLQGIAVEDHLGQGPLNQGNASALRYELQPGSTEDIVGDFVLGTINQEFNLSGFYNDRSFVFSARILRPTYLATLGKSFYTIPKTSRQNKLCDPSAEDCKNKIEDPIDISSLDLFLGGFKSDTLGNTSRYHFLFVGDDFHIQEDVSDNFTSQKARSVHKGEQGKFHTGFETEKSLSGGGQLALYSSIYRGKDINSSIDTIVLNPSSFETRTPWYREYCQGECTEPYLDRTEAVRADYGTGMEYLKRQGLWGARSSLGLEVHLQTEERKYERMAGIPEKLDNNFFEYTGLLRQNWLLSKGHQLVLSTGLYGVAQKPYYPLFSMRYSQSNNLLPWYIDLSLRQNSKLAPQKGAFTLADSSQFNESPQLNPYTTSSAEIKTGTELRQKSSLGAGAGLTLYTRLYNKPLLPEPDAYWFYKETQKADYAWVNGAAFRWTLTPAHWLGWVGNATFTQGEYILKGGGTLPWDANHNLGMTSHIRIQPRRDSLLALILTYTAQVDQPLYAWNLDTGRVFRQGGSNLAPLDDAGTRSVRLANQQQSLSRQRLDARIQIDLKSRWRPLEKIRFFAEVVNILDNREIEGLEWLGGKNEKVRGYTRNASDGSMEPVLIRGMGLFVLFGLHVNFAI